MTSQQLRCLFGLVALATSITISSSSSLAPTLATANRRDLTGIQFMEDKTSANYEQNDFGRQPTPQHLLVQASPIEISANVSTSSSSSSSSSNNNNYHQANQNPRFRVSVSNVCEKNHMRVSVRLSRPFYGLIHAKDKRKKVPCFVEGDGDYTYTLDISFTLQPTDAAYCGMVAANQLGASSTWTRQQHAQSTLVQATTTNQSSSSSTMLHGSQLQQETLSLALVVRLHKTIEFSDDRYFLLSCPNRCSRSDCSAATAAAAATGSLDSSQAHEKKGFVASDSILSPVFRSSASSSSTTTNDKQRQLQLAAPSERCDMMIDLKFQWLVKLCWILMALVALMFCTIFYLCVSSDSSKEGLSRRSKPTSCERKSINGGGQGREKLQAVASSGKSNQSATYLPKSSSSADTTESLANTELGWSSCSMVEQQQMDKLRHSNHYLANKQHLLLTDFLAAKSAMKEYEHQQQAGPILGRSEDVPGRRQLGHVMRRRSIGGSAAMPNCGIQANGTETLPLTPTPYQQRSDQVGPTWMKLDPRHKLKSKSQTTIYYEQSQDPFKAAPFNAGAYLGDGYHFKTDELGGSHRKSYEPESRGEVDTSAQPRTYTFMDTVQQSESGFATDLRLAGAVWSDFEPQSLPLVSSKFQAANGSCRTNPSQQHHFLQQQQQQWQQPIPTDESNSMQLVGQNRQHQQQQEAPSHLGASQFDPQNQSRQLIDLIQHKHRGQIVQANRTATTLKPTHHISLAGNDLDQPSGKLMPRPILMSQHQRQTNLATRTEQQWR